LGPGDFAGDAKRRDHEERRAELRTIGLIGHRDLPQFLDREIENFRRVLSEMD
jgi:hypothetical protein